VEWEGEWTKSKTHGLIQRQFHKTTKERTIIIITITTTTTITITIIIVKSMQNQ